uniref:N protein n=1 Tax=Pebjah virus TaxID=1658615 RepID=A0A0G2UH77_9NIDO|nr:N protein [Pebjah virus]
MAGKPKQNNKRKPQSQRRSSSRRQRPQSNRQAPRRAPQAPHAQQPVDHYVFAEPGDLRVLLAPKHGVHIQSLLLRYYGNGGGQLTFEDGRLNYSAVITPDVNLTRVLQRLAAPQT